MPFKLSAILSITAAIFKDRADLVAENMALRHQLSCLIHRGRQPKLRPVDRVFWVLLSRFWNGWRESLAIVKPATVLAWHRKGFKLFWRWKSRRSLRDLGRSNPEKWERSPHFRGSADCTIAIRANSEGLPSVEMD